MSESVRDNRSIILIAVLIMAAGIVAGGYLLGDGVRRARMADRAVTVRGLAERDVSADLATWTLNFSAQGSELSEVQAKIERDTQMIRNFFRAAGFPAEAVTDGGGSVSSYYDNNRAANVVTINRRLQFRSNDVARAQRVAARQFELIRGGVGLSEGSGGMQYIFTGLNRIKPDMIAAATRDARAGAERFATDSGTGVGGIRSATQGYFSIGPRDGDAVEEGSGGRDSPQQKVRVVTTIEFYLN